MYPVGINVNQEADSGHDQQHYHGKLVNLQVEPDPQIVVRHDPVKEFFTELCSARTKELANGFERTQETKVLSSPEQLSSRWLWTISSRVVR